MPMTMNAPKDTAPQRTTSRRAALKYFYNGNILTMNRAQPRASHMLLMGDRVWQCSDEEAPLGLNYREPGFGTARRQMLNEVEFIDLQGRTVLPGLVDAHCHFVWWALDLVKANLAPARSEQDCIEILRRHSGNVAPGEWILGFGWTQNLWTEPRFPSKASLDAAFPNNPVFLSSKCGHVAWANSMALKIGEIASSTPDPSGGEIERAHGEPTGILKETANWLVESRIGQASEERKFQALREGQQLAHSLGLTGLQTPEPLDTWGFLQRAHALGELTMRVNFWIPVAALEHLEALQVQHGLGSDRLRISAVKLFSDGSLGGRTALMYDPYEGEPDNFGICVTDRDAIRNATLRANRAGLPMAIHAIGDKAVDDVLAAYEAAAQELSTAGAPGTQAYRRNRIEHLQVFNPRDLERIRKLKPIASMQPVHLCTDMKPAEKFWGERSKLAYACRTLMEAGCPIVFGSDAPVESINPFHGLYVATSRCNMEGQPEGGWNSQEKLSLQESLGAYTINCAEASGQRAIIGDLAPGKIADFIVLEEDPFEISPTALRDMKPTATFSGGKCVYSTGAWAAEG